MNRTKNQRRKVINFIYRYVAATTPEADIYQSDLRRYYDVNCDVYVELPGGEKEETLALAKRLDEVLKGRGIDVDIEETVAPYGPERRVVKIWPY